MTAVIVMPQTTPQIKVDAVRARLALTVMSAMALRELNMRGLRTVRIGEPRRATCDSAVPENNVRLVGHAAVSKAAIKKGTLQKDFAS